MALQNQQLASYSANLQKMTIAKGPLRKSILSHFIWKFRMNAMNGSGVIWNEYHKKVGSSEELTF
jgi:hypothetical protein